MSSTYSINIGIEEPATGDYTNAWGPVVNYNMNVIDNVLGSATSIAMSSSNVTLTVAQAAFYRIIVTGNLTTNLELILPAGIGGSRHIVNNTTGSYALFVLNGAGDAGGGVVVPQGITTPVVLTGSQAFYDSYQAVPPGTILAYAGGGSQAPWGFAFCVGQTISAASYPLLFAAIGYTYGGGGGSFTLPDLRGRFIAAPDNMAGSAAGRIPGLVLSGSGGAASITLSSGQLPAHNHTITDPGHTHTLTDPGHTHNYNIWTTVGSGAGGNGTSPGYTSQSTGTSSNNTGITLASATTGITTQNTGSGSSITILPPYIGINYMIRY